MNLKVKLNINNEKKYINYHLNSLKYLGSNINEDQRLYQKKMNQ